jgi:hypothetical protein
MTAEEMRLECLKLALSNNQLASGVNAEQAVKDAEVLSTFILARGPKQRESTGSTA